MAWVGCARVSVCFGSFLRRLLEGERVGHDLPEPGGEKTIGHPFTRSTPMISMEFLITSLIVVLIPGTGVVYTVSTGLVQGRRASLFAAMGCTLGIVPHLVATIAGLAALMHTSALAFQLLKAAGVAYLFYLAYMTWKDDTAFAVDNTVSRSSALSLMTRAFLMNILNPKLTIFFLAFLPQFVDPAAAQPVLSLLLLSAVFMLMTLAVFVVYGLLAHAFRQSVIDSPSVQAWLRRGFAAAFAGLGARLAVSDQ
jgi:threonine/homoserine/homoserine lactone efflux protein